jgi:tellurite methyltransferase
MIHHHKEDFGPARLLTDNMELLPKGRVLDVAMGTGRNAVYLAKKGFEVEGVDISPEAVHSALNHAREAGITLKASVADLVSDYHIEKSAYDVIICFNYLQRSLITQIKDGLRVGGIVVYETFTVDQAQFGKPTNPNYLLKHNELLALFNDFRCLYYREGIVKEGKALASIIAKKVYSTEVS